MTPPPPLYYTVNVSVAGVFVVGCLLLCLALVGGRGGPHSPLPGVGLLRAALGPPAAVPRRAQSSGQRPPCRLCIRSILSNMAPLPCLSVVARIVEARVWAACIPPHGIGRLGPRPALPGAACATYINRVGRWSRARTPRTQASCGGPPCSACARVA